MAGIIDSEDLGFEEFDKHLEGLAGKVEELVGSLQGLDTQMTGKNKKSLKDIVEQINNLSASSKESTKTLAHLETKVDKLAGSQVKFEAESKKMSDALKHSKEEVKKLREELKNLEKSKGGATKASNQYNSSLKSLVTRFVGVYAGVRLMETGLRMFKKQLSEAFTATVEFESGMKQVEAISRATKAEIQALTANANKLGASTEYTSIQIANLQKELGKLGFSAAEIVNTTAAMTDLATATGEDLVEAAKVAAATMRVFNVSAVDSKRVIDVMAGSFVRSGLDLEKFRESMKLLGPIADTANISLELTTAMLSRLADAGISGSMAGTSLRNVISRMADPTSKIAKYLGYTVNSSEELTKAFRQLKEDGMGLSEVTQLMDVRARSAFITMVNQIGAVENLADEYKNLNGEGKKLADMMRDTLANDIEILGSAFDALRRGAVEDYTTGIRSMVQWTTDLTEAMRLTISGANNWDEFFAALSRSVGGFLFGLNGMDDKLRKIVVDGKIKESYDQLKSSLKGVAENFELGSAENVAFLETLRSSKLRIKELQDLSKKGLIDSEQTKELNLELQKMAGYAEQVVEQFGENMVNIDKDGVLHVQTELLGAFIRKQQESFKLGIEASKQEKENLEIELALTARKFKEKQEEYKLDKEALDAQNAKVRAIFAEKGGRVSLRAEEEETQKLAKKITDNNQDQVEILKQEEAIKEKLKLLNGDLANYADEIALLEKQERDLNEEVGTGITVRANWLLLEKQRIEQAIEMRNEQIKKEGASNSQLITYAKELADERKRLADVNLRIELQRIEDITASEDEKRLLTQLAQEKFAHANKQIEREMTNFIQVELQKRFDKEQEFQDRKSDEARRAINKHTQLISQTTAEYKALWAKETETEIQETQRALDRTFELSISKRRELFGKLVALKATQLQQERDLEEQDMASRKLNEVRMLRNSTEFAKSKLWEQTSMLDQIDQRYDKMAENVRETYKKLMADLKAETEDGTEEIASKIFDIAGHFMDGIGIISNELFQRESQKLKEQLASVSTWEQERTKLAGDNEEAKEHIRREAERRRQAIQLKQAKQERKTALFNIALSTAQSVAKSLAMFGVPLGLKPAAIAAVKGGIQYAAVASRPLPQFAEGTDYSPSGKAIVGEEGRELVTEKSGKTWLTPDKATIVDLKAGSKINTHEETEGILNKMSLSDDNAHLYNMIMRSSEKTAKSNGRDTDRLIAGFSDAISGIPTSDINITEDGIERFISKRGSKTRILNKRYNYKQ